jgi:hypothetical protein
MYDTIISYCRWVLQVWCSKSHSLRLKAPNYVLKDENTQWGGNNCRSITAGAEPGTMAKIRSWSIWQGYALRRVAPPWWPWKGRLLTNLTAWQKPWCHDTEDGWHHKASRQKERRHRDDRCTAISLASLACSPLTLSGQPLAVTKGTRLGWKPELNPL